VGLADRRFPVARLGRALGYEADDEYTHTPEVTVERTPRATAERRVGR
jgi:hypothetical protein